MVGTIFNLVYVNSSLHVYCLFLSQIVNTRLYSLAYIESITDATNDIEQIENKKQC